MPRPLPPGDPAYLGPFRLTARLAENGAGIVYLGDDQTGRQVSVAVLTEGAAADAAARDRFRAAIRAAAPLAAAEPAPGDGTPAMGDSNSNPPVVAAQPDGPAPWVAVAHEPDRADAGRFLEPVLLEGSLRAADAGAGHGPQYRPHWSGSLRPAMGVAPAPPAAAGVRRADRGPAALLLTLAVALALLAALLLLLFACRPQVTTPPPPPQDEPSHTYQPPPPPPPTPTPSGSATTPTPTPSGTSSPSPSPTPTDGPDGPDGGPL